MIVLVQACDQVSFRTPIDFQYWMPYGRCSMFHLGEDCATTTELDPISADSLYRWMPGHSSRQMHKARQVLLGVFYII